MTLRSYVAILARIIGYEAMRAGNPEYSAERAESPCMCEFCALDTDDREWWFDVGGES